MKVTMALVYTAILWLTAACQPGEPICPPDSIKRINQAIPIPSSNPSEDVKTDQKPVEVQINGKTVLVDQVIQGPLCQGNWSGTVYVGCDLQIAAWEEEADFLKGCNLMIEPGTVVYVAAHDNEPYYKGCSFHTGEDPLE